jgi:hypothetical protein
MYEHALALEAAVPRVHGLAVGLVGTGKQPLWVLVIMLGCTQAVGFPLHVFSLERGMRIMEQEEMHIYIYMYWPKIVSVLAASEMALYITPRKP